MKNKVYCLYCEWRTAHCKCECVPKKVETKGDWLSPASKKYVFGECREINKNNNCKHFKRREGGYE